MFKAETDIYGEVDHYIADLVAPEDEALKGAAQSLKDNNIPDASISPTQGKLLQVLAMACGAKRILELGTLGAYSTMWLVRALPEDGHIISLEYDENHASIAKANIEKAGLQDMIEVQVGKAIELLPTLEGPFDMIFIDADKPPYLEYFQWAIRLARRGSIIVADNVIRNGAVLDPNSPDDKVQGVQKLNRFLANCKDITATIIQTVGVKEHDGMVIAVVK